MIHLLSSGIVLESGGRMEIRQLEMLLAVVEMHGYVQAGKHLHISHSAIHRQIRMLEQELGERIFVRTGRTVRLTETGHRLTDLARRIKLEISSVEMQIKDMQTLVSGRLRIGTGTTTLVFFLLPVIERFRAEYPGVDIHLVTGTADQLIRELQAGNLDLGLVSEPPEGFPLEQNVRYQRLFTEEFVVAVSKLHPLARQKVIQWSELAKVSLILFTRASRIRRLIDSHFQKAGVEPRVLAELENEEAIEKMIEINLGAGFLSLSRARSEHLHYLRTAGGTVVLKTALVSSDSYVPRKTREFLRSCGEHAATLKS